MGVCCSTKSDKKYKVNEDMDLSEEHPDSNAFDRFKRKFPLARTHVDLYFKKVNELEGDQFSPEEMAAKFST